ncbi:MAG: hypothetical protein C3F19_16485 [Rhodocyclales bacterium]|jgi:hypothetical protein|nr:hypothetical protein [Rhodocyclaceae bacterium]PWB39232.1 MAG: hypothetical protein C3F19_16485 [Rhodocyclales bacterium]GIK25381.1 MAG: hypothetical protein BroJett006_16270 [Betaproteobacteria bacterium]
MSDDIFGKADALMKRRAFVAGGAQPAPPPEDVPVLTEVVDPSHAVPALTAALSGSPGAEQLAERMRDLLGPLPPDIARAVENWLVATLPRLVARRLDGIAEQVAEEVGAALRETLPLLISDLIRSAQERTKQGK